MTSVRILHASDLHIARRAKLISFTDNISAGMYFNALKSRALVSSYNPTLLVKMTEYIYNDYVNNHVHHRSAPIDAVLITGDIATTGLRAALQAALTFVQGPADRKRSGG